MTEDDQGAVISLAERRAQSEARAAEAARDQARRQAAAHAGDKPGSKPWVTYTVIGLNVAVWVVMVALGVDFYEPAGEALVRFGGNLGLLTTGGEWWRLFTAMFIHAGIIHLAFNMYFAWVVGRLCEQIFGAAAYVVVYLGSGLLASLVSVAWQPAIVSVGASGALFGVFGAFLGFTVRRREALPAEFVSSVKRNAFILIGINLAIGIAVPGIDVAAHIGGLVAGLGIGYSIARLAERPVANKQEAKRVRQRAIGMTAAATLVILLAGALAVPRWDNPTPVLDRIGAAHDDVLGRYEAAPDDTARIALLEREVLPLMRASEAELAGLDRLPAPVQEVVELRVRYFRLQTEAYELELAGLRDADEIVLAEAENLHAEAIAVLQGDSSTSR